MEAQQFPQPPICEANASSSQHTDEGARGRCQRQDQGRPMLWVNTEQLTAQKEQVASCSEGILRITHTAVHIVRCTRQEDKPCIHSDFQCFSSV